ncbi:5'-nucleotidase, lipoprotein e(P4) family [Marinomonas posidonica]|uniref:5'-nucleotidase, lipoprotein e(P4) family n=1 Tax=Marinomonas posidonica (strain CECT 7376 / NCIMB 14433 / IVIA-Po-181) TaxID=491952 RepID=F6CUT7_MARPP|nr:5'-nucleotidase, lipoprotein e(P4) family [Marinomonas posidonica]AEF55263.1 5'-nucleotidase, lipoprotein e(P4) family [Marinomonas posidonica IVIA-Po-181]
MFFTNFRTVMLSTVLLAGSVSLPALAHDSDYNTKDLNEQLVMSTLWMQASAEYKAMSYQAFNLAKMQFDHYLDKHKGNKKVAVVVDADETVIDNSDYQAWLIGKDFGYSSKTWSKWMAAADAKAMPGATDFLNYVASKGAEVFYVTNRKIVGLEGTRKNLKALGFPNVDDKHLMLRTDTSNKEPRRDAVAKNYDIALFMGDNLNDFSNDFRTKSLAESDAAVEKNKALFGTRFIVLPNPAYGDWEGKVYNGNWGATAAEKDRMRKSKLHVWHPAK